MTKKEKAADTRLKRVRGIDLSEYNKLEAVHDHNCWICGRKVKENKRFAVDHDHRFDKYKYIAVKDLSGKWTCRAEIKVSIPGPNKSIWCGEPFNTSKEAKDNLRRFTKRRAVRGLLCFKCNRGLAYWRDNIKNMLSAVTYLQNYNNLLEGGKSVIE